MSRALLTAAAGFAGMKLQFPGPQDQAVLRRKAGIVRGRLLADAKRKTKQAERMLGNAASVSSSAQEKGEEAELLARNSAKVRDADVRTRVSPWESRPCRPAPSLDATLHMPHVLRAQGVPALSSGASHG